MAFAKTQEREQPEFSNRPQPIRGKMGATIPGHTNSLLKRCLGSSGLEITTVGFGAWALGGGDWAFGWGPQDDNASVATMRRALELGVNWIDTAAIYGLGHSEEVVGRLLRELPASERPLIFTKCGLIWDEHNRMAEPHRVLKPESIRQECEASLRRLGVERIDLYQFHWPDEAGMPVEEAIRHVDSLQPPFSLIRRDVAAREITWCAEHGTGVICYSPMQSGLLTDTFSRERVASFAPDDWRRRSPEFQEPNVGHNLALRDALRPIAQRHDTTVSAVAIAWTIAWPGVTGAIVGARSPQQVDGWIGAASLELTSTDLEEIAAAIERTGAGTGPTLPTIQKTTEAA